MKRPWLTTLLAVALAVALWGWPLVLTIAFLASGVFAYWAGRHDERQAHQAELDGELEAMLDEHPELDALADGTPF